MCFAHLCSACLRTLTRMCCTSPISKESRQSASLRPQHKPGARGSRLASICSFSVLWKEAHVKYVSHHHHCQYHPLHLAAIGIKVCGWWEVRALKYFPSLCVPELHRNLAIAVRIPWPGSLWNLEQGLRPFILWGKRAYQKFICNLILWFGVYIESDKFIHLLSLFKNVLLLWPLILKYNSRCSYTSLKICTPLFSLLMFLPFRKLQTKLLSFKTLPLIYFAVTLECQVPVIGFNEKKQCCYI